MSGDQKEWIVYSRSAISSICPFDVDEWFYKDGSDCSLKVICGVHEFNKDKDSSGNIALIPEITPILPSVAQNSSGIQILSTVIF